jgi:nucleoid-associated protein YgaU
MGLFSFLKNAGAKIFGGKSAAAPAASPTVDHAAIQAQKEAALRDAVIRTGLPVTDLNVSLADDVLTVTGQAETQSVKEKVILILGNTEGIAAVDDQMTVLNPEPEATFYTVQKGDSLSKIAKEFYGDMMRYPAIFEANRPMLEHPDKIYPGQVLRIPAA